MKRIIAVILSVIMLACSVTGLDFSALAEDGVTKITIGSEVENSTSKMVFSYDVKINGEPYNGTAVGDSGKEYEVKNGIASILAKDFATISIPLNSKYEIKRLEFEADGYYTLPESEVETGTADNFNYYEVVEDFEYPITAEEYNEATNNGTLSPAIVTYYTNPITGERLKKNEVKTGTFYSESVAGEASQEIGYKKGEKAVYPSSLKITTTLVERKATTSVGKDSFYYTGEIAFEVGDAVYSENYTATLSTDKAQAGANAVTTVKATARAIVIRALNELVKDKGTSAYLSGSIEELMPSATDFGDSTTPIELVNQALSVWEFVPYEKETCLYVKEACEGIKNIVFYGELVYRHYHSYSNEVVAPTCTEQGYTLHRCSCGEEYKDSYVKTISHKYESSVKAPATEKSDGIMVKKCKMCGKSSESVIPSIKSISLSKTAYTYDGKAKKPSVTIKDSKGKKLVENTDYTVSYASGRKKVGEYKVTIKFLGKYKGNAKRAFAINPKGTSISKLTPFSKGFTAKWKKQTNQTTGYQLEYSTSSKFTNSKSVTILKGSTTSKDIKKLSGGKKYYVRIRTFKTISGTRYYSAWSKTQTVKTKK